MMVGANVLQSDQNMSSDSAPYELYEKPFVLSPAK